MYVSVKEGFLMSELATIWSSAATLIALTFAWVTFAVSAHESRRTRFEGLRNLVAGLEKELELIKLWAGSEEEGDGYLAAKKAEDYFKEQPDWSNPSRVIFKFDYPAIKNLTASQYVASLGSIIDAFVALNYSIVRLYNFYEEYREYVMARPELYDSVQPKFRVEGRPVGLTTSEHDFVMHTFDYNYRIHVNFIGGKDSPDGNCLYKAYNRARSSLRAFSRQANKPDPAPRGYIAGYILAALFTLGAVFLLIR